MYSIDIINLCITHYNKNLNLHKIAYNLNIITTIINNTYLNSDIYKIIIH